MAIINGYTAETIKTTLDKIKDDNILEVKNGGTGKESLTNNAFLLGNTTSAIKNISVTGGTGRGYLYWAGSTSADPQISLQSIISLDDGGTGNDDWKSSSHNNLVIFDHTNRKLSPKIKINTSSPDANIISSTAVDLKINSKYSTTTSIYNYQVTKVKGYINGVTSTSQNLNGREDILISGEAFCLTAARAYVALQNLGSQYYDGDYHLGIPDCLPFLVRENYKVFPRLRFLEEYAGKASYQNPLLKPDGTAFKKTIENFTKTIENGEEDGEEDIHYTGKTISEQLENLEINTELIQSTIDETINPAIQSIGDRMDNVEEAETNLSSFLQDLDLENKIADIDENISHISNTLENFDIDNVSEKLQAIEDSNIYSRLNAVESLALENESGLNSQYSQLFDINNTTIPAINNNIANMNTTITGRLNTLETFKTDIDNLNISTNLSSLNQFKEDIEDLDLSNNLETINEKIVKVAKCLSKVSEVNTANEFSVDESGNIEFNSEDNTPYTPSQGDVISGGTVVVIEDNSSGDDPLSPGGEGSFEPVSVLDFSDNNFVIIEDDSITSVTIPDEEVNVGHSFKIANLTNNSSALSISFANLHTTLKGIRISDNSYSLLAGGVATFICIKKVEQGDYFVYTWLVY